MNDRRSLALQNTLRLRAGLEPSSGRDLASSMAYAARMIMPITFPAVDADLLHVTSSGSALLAALPSYAQGVPIVLSEHGVFYRERLMALRSTEWSFLQRNMVAAFLKSITKVGYEAADSIAPVSDFNSLWEIAMGADPEKVRTVHNGVDIDYFRPVAAEPKVPTIVFVGRMDPLKDLRNLVLAIPRIAEQGPRRPGAPDRSRARDERRLRGGAEGDGRGSWGWPIASSGWDRRRTRWPPTPPGRSLCSPRSPRGSRTGHWSPWPAACRSSPRTSEGSPRWWAMRASWSPRASPTALADACAYLLGDAAERQVLARLGRARVEERFSLERMLARFRESYATVAGLPRGRAPRRRRDGTEPAS